MSWNRAITADERGSGAMSDQITDLSNVEQLIGEIGELRGKVAQLQERIEQLDQLAHEDSLVGLPNRRGFMRAVERLIDRVNRYEEKVALLFIDVDGLKLINDTLGHQAGDEASDIVARIGGDEFAILLSHSDEQSAQETATRLQQLIAGCEFTHCGQVLPLSVAIGAAGIHADDTPDKAMARADREMYRQKAAA
jgi:diguanylate cyclase (GGDEF)-like protein